MCCYERNSSCRPARKKAILQTVTEEYRGERKWPNPLWKHKALDCHPHRLTVKGKGEGKDAATLNIVYCVKLLWGELKSIEYKHMKKLKPRVDGPDFSKKMQKLLPMHTLSKGFKETLKGLVQLPKQAGMPISWGPAGEDSSAVFPPCLLKRLNSSSENPEQEYHHQSFLGWNQWATVPRGAARILLFYLV